MSSHDGESLETTEASPETAEASPETAAFGQDDVSAVGEEPPSRKWSRRRWKVITIVAVVLAAIILASSLISLPYYAITPGASQSVLPLIGVPAAHSQNHNGSIDLVDVEVTPLRLIDWLYFKLDPNATLYSSAAIQGPETSAQYNIEGVLDMADAQQAATVVALTQLGYHVTVIPNGSLVYALDPGSPADAGLQVGDVIIGIGSQAVNSPTALSAALFPYKIGESLTIRYRPFQSSVAKTATIQTGAWRWMGTGSNQQLTCLPAAAKSSLPIAKLYDDKGALYLPTKQHPGGATACLGVLDAEPSYHVVLPFQVDLNSEGIVGPSAGLAFTLGLMQKLDTGNLTGGLKVAATGTMSVTGQIGAIGGIQQKTIAVRSSGASIFLVPPDNYAIAKKYAGSTLKVFAVSTIAQALSVLERYGGKVVKVTGS